MSKPDKVRVEIMDEDPDPSAENYRTVATQEFEDLTCPVCDQADVEWVLVTPVAVTYAHRSGAACNTQYSRWPGPVGRRDQADDE